MKLVACLSLLVVMVAASRLNDGPRVFCGRALAEARIHYCFGADITEHLKRDDKKDLHPSSNSHLWPWFALRFYSLTKRIPGLVDECCLQPCYVSQLLSYC